MFDHFAPGANWCFFEKRPTCVAHFSPANGRNRGTEGSIGIYLVCLGNVMCLLVDGCCILGSYLVVCKRFPSGSQAVQHGLSPDPWMLLEQLKVQNDSLSVVE